MIESKRTEKKQICKSFCIFAASLFVFLCSGCKELKGKEKVSLPTERQFKTYDDMKPMFSSPLSILGKDSKSIEKSSVLWYGALKALERIPLEVFSPERGFLQTHWYIPAHLPHHRLQVKVFIMPCQEICVEAVSVTVLHQVLKHGKWILISTSLELEQKIKRSVLLHARDYAVQNK
ncbi:DUF3576 domain-containing protein [Holospora obtusa]|nr:DUF3576 domain-containing protein [Holospora obtusa]